MDPVVEPISLGFETIEGPLATPSHGFGRAVEQQYEIRPQSIERPIVDRSYLVDAQTSTAALVGQG